MVYNRYRLIFWVRMLIILTTTGLFVIWLPKTNLSFAPILFVGLLIIQILALLHHMEKPQRDINRFFDAIRYSDFTQTFSDKTTDRSILPMKEAFSKVLEAFQKTRAEKEAHHRYLQTVVQHVGVGLLVFKWDGQVDMANQAVRKLFGIRNIKHLNALSKIKPTLPETIAGIRPGEKSHVQFQHLESGNLMTLSINATHFIIQGEAFTLASIQNIQNELEEKELEAWQNLIRVLTHEIINSITPITSLASTANQLLEKSSSKNIKADTFQDVNQAVKTIETRSQGLLKFVQSYRQLTRLPQPDFKIINLQEMFEHIDHLMRPRFNEKQVIFENHISPISLEITADRNLIEQVLINLLQNALYWSGRKSEGHVIMNANMGSGSRSTIQVIDNGPGIQKEALDKIFIPFFTTKEEGTGIGLSLSRQIMQSHKGHITAQSVPNEETIFTLRF